METKTRSIQIAPMQCMNYFPGRDFNHKYRHFKSGEEQPIEPHKSQVQVCRKFAGAASIFTPLIQSTSQHSSQSRLDQMTLTTERGIGQLTGRPIATSAVQHGPLGTVRTSRIKLSPKPAGRYQKVRDPAGSTLLTPPLAGAESGDPGDLKDFCTTQLVLVTP